MKFTLTRSVAVRVLPVAIIFCLAAFLRFYHLVHIPPGLHPDEAMNGINALEHGERATSSGSTLKTASGRLVHQPPSLCLGPDRRNEPWVLRLVSAVFGVLTVVAFYYFSREILDESTGRLAALLMATSVWHINVSRIAHVLFPAYVSFCGHCISSGEAPEDWQKVRDGIGWGRSEAGFVRAWLSTRTLRTGLRR